MALTKTVNYVQNNPQDLGFNDEISGTTGEVTVVIKWNSWGGYVPAVTFGNSMSSATTTTCDQLVGLPSIWVAKGSLAEVNGLLNLASWNPASYATPNIEQNPLALDRVLGTYEGEVLIEMDTYPPFAVGSTFTLKNSSNTSELYTVTAIEASKSQYRFYSVPVGNNVFTHLAPYDTEVIDSQGRVVGIVLDCAILNPSGTYKLDITVSDDTGVVETGTVTLAGSLFVKEPYFVEYPNSFVYVPDSDFTVLGLGQIAQDNNELVTVQLLIKLSENDPDFLGDLAKNQPYYIPSSKSFGCFSNVMVDNRISETPEDEFVWWQFYGTPAQCNAALRSVSFFKQPTTPGFLIEVRIINSRSRIYFSRGIN